MHTSLGLVALAVFLLAPSPAQVPSWQPSYDHARLEGKKTGKPVAVIIGSGKQGYDSLTDEGRLSRTTRKVLAAHYVPVYVNVDTPEGHRLAEAFGVTEGTGLVLSDRTGELQAFYHDGTLSNEDLRYYLRRYANPHLVVRTTEQVPSEYVSYYPPQESPAPAQSLQPYVPVQPFIPASFGGFGGGGGGC
jgi:hypothetical protein